MDDGGDVGHHGPSVVSQRGVTGGVTDLPGGGTRRDKSRRHTASMEVEYVLGGVRCQVSG